jgi:hypothetical protein
MINQALIVRDTASVCEIFYCNFRKRSFSAESIVMSDPKPYDVRHRDPPHDLGQLSV